MKLLLDECLPVDFRHEIPGHDVFTVAFMKWKGIKNGQLLALAASNGFDVLITIDQNFDRQQDLSALPLAIVILETSNRLPDLRAIARKLLHALTALVPRSVTRIRP